MDWPWHDGWIAILVPNLRVAVFSLKQLRIKKFRIKRVKQEQKKWYIQLASATVGYKNSSFGVL